MDSSLEDLTPFRVTVRIRPFSDKEKQVRANKIIRNEESTVNPN